MCLLRHSLYNHFECTRYPLYDAGGGEEEEPAATQVLRVRRLRRRARRCAALPCGDAAGS